MNDELREGRSVRSLDDLEDTPKRDRDVPESVKVQTAEEPQKSPLDMTPDELRAAGMPAFAATMEFFRASSPDTAASTRLYEGMYGEWGVPSGVTDQCQQEWRNAVMTLLASRIATFVETDPNGPEETITIRRVSNGYTIIPYEGSPPRHVQIARTRLELLLAVMECTALLEQRAQAQAQARDQEKT